MEFALSRLNGCRSVPLKEIGFARDLARSDIQTLEKKFSGKKSGEDLPNHPDSDIRPGRAGMSVSHAHTGHGLPLLTKVTSLSGTLSPRPRSFFSWRYALNPPLACAVRSPACRVLRGLLHGVGVKQAAEYRQHAAECRKLAMNARNEPERVQLMQMADAWERMAMERERQIMADAEKPMEPPA